MSDTAGGAAAAGRQMNVAARQGPGPVRRMFELLFMLFSAILVLFSWNSAKEAQEENAVLRNELRMTKKRNNKDRPGSHCVVCLDNPREVVIQDCGHVCLCSDCAARIRSGDNKCPICREFIYDTAEVFIS